MCEVVSRRGNKTPIMRLALSPRGERRTGGGGDESVFHFHMSVELRGRGRKREKRWIKLYSNLYIVFVVLLVLLHGLCWRVKPTVHMTVKRTLPQFPAEQNMEHQLSAWKFQGCSRLSKECRDDFPTHRKKTSGVFGRCDDFLVASVLWQGFLSSTVSPQSIARS